MNLVKIANMLKDAPDQSLIQEMQSPTGSVPSYMVLSELQRRKKLRGSMMSPEPQSSVAEDQVSEASQVNQMGIGSLGAVGAASQPAPAPQGFAQGGEVKGYYDGGGVDYEDTLPWDERMQKWREMTGFGRMAPPPAVRPVMAPTSAAPSTAPAVAPPVAPLGRPPVAAAPAMPRPAAPVAATPEKMEDWGQQIKDIVGKQADAYQKQADTYAKQAEQLDKTKSTDISLALMQAGFGIMGGRSQFAAENIGQGAAPAVQQYAAMDRARREQAQKLALGQGALGIEQLGSQLKGVSAGAEYGLGKEKLDIARKEAESNAIYKRALAGAAGAGKSDANAMRLMGLREKAIEALEKQFDFQGMTPEQQEAAIQRRMMLLSGQYSTMGGMPQGVKVTPIK